MAIAALVLGVSSILLFWAFAVVPIVALVVGGIALRRIRREGRGGRGLAIAGSVLGGIGLLAFIVVVAVTARNQGAGGVVLREDFNSGKSGRFSTDSDRLVDLSMADGRYKILIKDPVAPQFIRTFFDRSQGGLRFEATVTQVTGPDRDAVFAVGCWAASAAYLAVITPTGEVGILETISEQTGERRPLTELQTVRAARRRGEPNRLRIDCVGGGRGPTIVSAWVNGEPVVSVAVPDGIDSFNAVGFWLASTAPGTEYGVDDVEAAAERPDPPKPPVPPIPSSKR